jgi:hypothetical protein
MEELQLRIIQEGRNEACDLKDKSFLFQLEERRQQEEIHLSARFEPTSVVHREDKLKI